MGCRLPEYPLNYFESLNNIVVGDIESWLLHMIGCKGV